VPQDLLAMLEAETLSKIAAAPRSVVVEAPMSSASLAAALAAAGASMAWLNKKQLRALWAKVKPAGDTQPHTTRHALISATLQAWSPMQLVGDELQCYLCDLCGGSLGSALGTECPLPASS
jgi:hypothetical protein